MDKITDKAARLKLKQFLEDWIPVDDLKKAGFFGKGIRRTDYERIAAKVCYYFGFKSIYEYRVICRGKACDGINCTGDSKYCKSYSHEKSILQWAKLEVHQEDIVSQDKYLN